MSKKSLQVFIPFIALIFVASGCAKEKDGTAATINNGGLVAITKNSDTPVESKAASNLVVRSEFFTGPSTINTGGWQVYENKVLGFEIRFPKDWTYKSPAYAGGMAYDGNVYHVLGMTNGKFEGDWGVLVSYASTTVESLLKDPNYYWNKSWTRKVTKDYYSAGVHYKKVTWSNGAVVAYIWGEDYDGVLEIIVNNKLEKWSDTIIKSVRVNWQSYKSIEHGYSIKYPSNYKESVLTGENSNVEEYPKIGVIFIDKKTKQGTFEEVSVEIYDKGFVDFSTDFFERNIFNFEKNKVKDLNSLKSYKEFATGEIVKINSLECFKLKKGNELYYILQNQLNSKWIVFATLNVDSKNNPKMDELNKNREELLVNILSTVTFLK
ncbi:hypothetical protein HGA64_03215 [Candidatus Falkowbacteria bacterium]|nr:hypothetical protein [Candidatus Falkowbacteria bacterium]